MPRLSNGERAVWAACYANKYAKEVLRGHKPEQCATAAVIHAARGVNAMRAIAPTRVEGDTAEYLTDMIGGDR